jgi:protein-tyrosine phosphatase
MPTVLDWTPAVDPSELVRVVRETLQAGSPVVVPGDSGYLVVVNPAAASTISHLSRFPQPPAVLAGQAEDPERLGLSVPLAARRLMVRAWPAPLAIALPGTPQWPTGWLPPLPDLLLAAGPLRFRYPEHPLIADLVRSLAEPMLIAETAQATAEAVLDQLDATDAVAIAAGELPPQGPVTVVTAHERGYDVTQAGLLPTDEIEQLAARMLLFVCTGNTCRSPLAEGLARKLLADRLGCRPEDLPRRGFWVLSAGVAAGYGSPASEEAIAVAQEWGVDLSGHRSRPINPALLAAADDIIAMTRGHALALQTRYPGVGKVPQLLCGEADLDDPIGASLEVYRNCARTIVAQLERFLPEWTGT